MKIHLASLFILLTACTVRTDKTNPSLLTIKQGNNTYIIELRKISDSLNMLSTRKQGDSLPFNEWELPYPVYSLQTGDVDASGTDDILVGVIKKTKYDPYVRKRLFIFKLIDGLIRPLWLGSRVAHSLCTFKYVKKQHRSAIVTVEKEKSKNKYLVAEYRWKSFGLQFIRYVKRNISYKNAQMQISKL